MVIGLNIIVGCELTFSHANYDEYLNKVEKLSSLSHILLIMTERAFFFLGFFSKMMGSLHFKSHSFVKTQFMEK